MPTTFTPARQACLDLIGEDETLILAGGRDDAILGIAEYERGHLVVYDNLSWDLAPRVIRPFAALTDKEIHRLRK